MQNQFFESIKNNDINNVFNILSQDFDIHNNNININTQDSVGKTGLMISIKKNFKEITMMLIEAGANLDIQDNNGSTALMICTSYNQNNEDIAEMLIEAGANLDIQDNNGSTALMICTLYSLKNIEIAEMLIKKGANLDIKDNFGNTVLILSGKKNNKKMIEMLIKAGAKLDIQNNIGKTALYYVDRENKKKLIKAGSNPFIRDIENKDSLYDSIFEDNFELFKLIMKKVSNKDLNNLKYDYDDDLHNYIDLTIPLLVGYLGLKDFLIYLLKEYKININYVDKNYNTLYNISRKDIQNYLSRKYEYIIKLSSEELVLDLLNKNKRKPNKGFDLFVNEKFMDYLFGKSKRKQKKSKRKSIKSKSKSKSKSKY